MNAVLKGQFLKMDSYYSEKQSKDVPYLVVFDGKESIRVDSAPVKVFSAFKLGMEVTVPVRVYNSQYGLRVYYNGEG